VTVLASKNSRIYERYFGDGGGRFGIKLIIPQHTEESYAQEVQDQTSAVMCTHELFPAHRVQFKHLKKLGQGNFSTIDEVEPSGWKVLPSKIYARKVFALKRHLNRVTTNAGLDVAKTLYHPIQ
jgi:hypothetical protein